MQFILELDRAECEQLIRLLEDRIVDLEESLRNTDDPMFLSALKRKDEVLRNLLHRLLAHHIHEVCAAGDPVLN